MENASRALIMAASVLLGIMIISVGVALFQSFGGFSRNIANEIERNKISEFNSQFLKYYNENIELTAHDVVTLANLAHKTNIEQEVNENNISYIKIKLTNSKQSLEKLTEEQLNKLLQEQSDELVKINDEIVSRYYYKISQINYDENSKKVNEVYIDKYERKSK